MKKIVSFDRDKQRLLAEYFLRHPDVQNIFWKKVANTGRVDDILGVPEEYKIAKWYFAQEDPSILNAFLDTTGINTDNFTQEEKTLLLQKLVGCAALFQKTYPTHPNAVHLRNGLRRRADEAGLQDVIATSLEILEGKILGSVSVTENEKGLVQVKTHLPAVGQTADDFRLARQDDLYMSNPL